MQLTKSWLASFPSLPSKDEEDKDQSSSTDVYTVLQNSIVQIIKLLVNISNDNGKCEYAWPEIWNKRTSATSWLHWWSNTIKDGEILVTLCKRLFNGCFYWPISSVLKHTLSVREVWGSIPGPVKSAQCRHRCNVSSDQCYPGAKPRRWPCYSLHTSV